MTPKRPRLWLYAGLPSYAVGDSLTLHLSTDVPNVDILISRDGARLQEMARFTVSTPSFHPIPEGAARQGCGWPATITLPLPTEWPSGGYVVTARSVELDKPVSAEAFFVLRARRDRRSRLALIASNYTWAAYNNWGGGCFYPGSEPDDGELLETVSLFRPWARGQIRLPVGAPTMRTTSPPRHRLGRTPPLHRMGAGHWALTLGGKWGMGGLRLEDGALVGTSGIRRGPAHPMGHRS